jgi:hypothetical protein
MSRNRPRPRTPSRRAVFVLYLALAAAFGVAGVAIDRAGLPLSLLTRDVFSIGEIPVYAGFFSNLGILAWCAAAAVTAFVWLVVRGKGTAREGFLAASALFSAVLMADDLFMFHEWLAPRFLGVSERVVLGIYAVGMIAYVTRFRGAIRQVGAAPLVAALVLFALSTGLDLVEPVDPPEWHYYVEDGLKLGGIAAWVLFLGVASAEALGRARGGGPPPSQSAVQASAASKSASPAGARSRKVSS